MEAKLETKIPLPNGRYKARDEGDGWILYAVVENGRAIGWGTTNQPDRSHVVVLPEVPKELLDAIPEPYQ